MQKVEKKWKRTGRLLCAAILISGLLWSMEGQVSAKETERLDAGVAKVLENAEAPEASLEKEKKEEMDFLEDGAVGEAALSVDEADAGRGKEKETVEAKNEKKGTEREAEQGTAQKETAQTETGQGEPGSLVMTSVTNTLNVRSKPDEEAEKVGYLYADCGGIILERKNGWTKLESGHLTGWAKDDFLIFGEAALEEAKDVGRTIARVTGETVRIRKEPSGDAAVYDLAAKGELFEVLDEAEILFSGGVKIGSEWTAVDYEGSTGYVSTRYLSVDFEYDTGETLEEIAARQDAEKQAKEASSSNKNGTDKKDADKENSKKEQSPGKQNAGGIPAGTSDVTLLAALIQCESGSEIYDGQLAVGAVVVNRVKSGSYPNTITDVIFASGQFGPAGSGKLARVIESGKIKSSCIQAANEALSGVTNVGSATHFRRAGSRDGIVIGNHVFW